MAETFTKGQSVVIVGRAGRPDFGREPATVTAIGRTLIHVTTRNGAVWKFRKEDGYENDQMRHRQVLSHEALDERDRRQAAVKRLQSFDVHVVRSTWLSVDQLEAMVGIVDPAHKEEST